MGEAPAMEVDANFWFFYHVQQIFKEMLKTLQVSGKLTVWPSVAMAAGRNKHRLLYARDRRSRCQFLVDTGAVLSKCTPSYLGGQDL